MLVESGTAAIGAARVVVKRRIPQAPGYHDFADRRSFLGVANFWDVISNVPFLVVGIWGLFVVMSNKFQASPFARSESWPYIVFFLGLALTFLGSSYYHLQPTNFRLMWDRLPMTLGFMGILCGTIAERISLSAGIRLLPPLVLLGLSSVGYLVLDRNPRTGRSATILSGSVRLTCGRTRRPSAVSATVHAELVPGSSANTVYRSKASGLSSSPSGKQSYVRAECESSCKNSLSACWWN